MRPILACEDFMHRWAFAVAAKLLTNALQVPESLGRWLLEARVKPITGVPKNAGVEHNLRKTTTRSGAPIGRKFLREENYDEMANA
jgi:hypothetical protein